MLAAAARGRRNPDETFCQVQGRPAAGRGQRAKRPPGAL